MEDSATDNWIKIYINNKEVKTVKYSIILLSSFCFFILHFSCKKEDKKEYTNLKDSILYCGMYENSTLNVDIDNDGSSDVAFGAWNLYGSAGGYSQISISVYNGFEVAIAKTARDNSYIVMGTNGNTHDSLSIDSVDAPKVFHRGNVISNNNNFSDSTQTLMSIDNGGSSQPPFGWQSTTVYWNPGIDDVYIGLRKKVGDQYNYAWIKVRCPDENTLIVRSCRYSPNCDYLIIIDN
jgi:hypothetical protein